MATVPRLIRCVAVVARCEARTPAGLQRICVLMKKAITAHPQVGDFEWEY